MYIKFSSQTIGANYTSSCGGLVNYLEKENKDLKIGDEKEYFFNSTRDDVTATEVVDAIDGNAVGKGLKDKDVKFYNIIVAPSNYELKTIQDDPGKLRDYTRQIMADYADKFNRTSANGEKVTIKDLEWFAKVERHRTFTGSEMMVKHNEKYKSLQRAIEKAEINPVPQPQIISAPKSNLPPDLEKKYIEHNKLYDELFRKEVYGLEARLENDNQLRNFKRYVFTKDGKVELKERDDIKITDWIIGKEQRGKQSISRLDALKQQLNNMGGQWVINSAGKVEKTHIITDKDTLIKRGVQRPDEYQSHVHIIVSRCHKTERMSLSPMANNRGGKNKLNGKNVTIGFDRMQFAKDCEVIYDLTFDHKRNFKQSVNSTWKKGQQATGFAYYCNISNEKMVAKFAQQNQLKLSELGYNQFACFMRLTADKRNPDEYGLRKRFDAYAEQFSTPAVVKSLDKLIDNVGKMDILDKFSNINIAAKLVQQTAKQVVNAVTKSYYIGL